MIDAMPTLTVILWVAGLVWLLGASTIEAIVDGQWKDAAVFTILLVSFSVVIVHCVDEQLHGTMLIAVWGLVFAKLLKYRKLFV